jgi:hypothetical protein
MLVIISDLHLTDGTSGETIRPGAFRAFRESLRELAFDASWRSDKRYVPIDGIDLVLLGDILDVIRSTRWCGAPARVRPWGDQNDPRFSDLVSRITEGVIRNNQQSLNILRSLHNSEIMSFRPLPRMVGWRPNLSTGCLCPSASTTLSEIMTGFFI